MCEVLKVSRSVYYQWLKGGVSKRKVENMMLTDEIGKIFNNSKQTYGSQRVTKALHHMGIKVSRARVAKLMKHEDYMSKVKKKYCVTTDSNHKYPVAENLLNRAFKPNRINKAWVSDITYIKAGYIRLLNLIYLIDRL